MKYIPLTRGINAIVDDDSYEELNKYKWFASPFGYAKRNITVKPGVQRGIYMHNSILPRLAGFTADHINGIKYDNRKENLRYATHAENCQNARVRKGKRHSKYKGVSYDRGKTKWIVQINSNKKKTWVGAYATEIEAALAYDEAAKRLHGAFAWLNFKEENKNGQQGIN